MSQFFTASYTLENKARLFDLGQSAYINYARLAKKGSGTLRPFTAMLRKMKRQCLVFFALAALQGGLLAISDVTTVKIVLPVFCAGAGAFMWMAWRAQDQAYDGALTAYLGHGAGGTVTFDEAGITETDEQGVETHFAWAEYVGCLLCGEAIVVISTRPVMLILSRTAELEATLRQALEAFGKADTLLEAEVRER